MSEIKKILFINRSYWPDAEATGQLLTELCEDLAELEQLQISVICGQPNFNLDDVEFEESGVQLRNNVEIIRVKHSQFDKSTFLGRVTNFITFLMAAFWKALWTKKPDLMVVETDPPLLCLLGFVVSRIRGIKFVCYLQDVYPDIAVELGRLKENLLTRLLRWSFLHAYRNSDKVVVVGSDMKKWLINHRVAAEKINIIENWVDTERIRPEKENNSFRHKFDLEDKFVVMYSGNLGYTQRFDLILDAAEELQDEKDIVFSFVGNGVKRNYLFNEMLNRGLPNIRFMDYQPKSELKNSLSAADLHLVLLDSKLTPHMLPSKAYSALASATPLLGVGASRSRIGAELTPSHLADLIEQNDAGVFVDESDAKQIAEMIVELRDQAQVHAEMSQNARVAAETNHTKDVAVREFEQVFEELGVLDLEFRREEQQIEAAALPSPSSADSRQEVLSGS